MDTKKLNEILEMHQKWLQGAGGERADLSFTDLSGIVIDSANLTRAYLEGADFSATSLRNSNFDQADLSHASFENSFIEGCSFVAANLEDANFEGSRAYSSRMHAANFAEANFKNTDLTVLKFSGFELIKSVEDIEINGALIGIPQFLSMSDEDMSEIDKDLSLFRKEHINFLCSFLRA